MIVEGKEPSLSLSATEQSPEVVVAHYQGQQLHSAHFREDVAQKASALMQRPEMVFALYYEEAYPFAVMLFALWHAGKDVWIAANNRPVSAENLRQKGCCLVGDWLSEKAMLLPDKTNPISLSTLDLHRSTVTLFTSGSTGQPQPIRKQLWQLQNEVDALELQWGAELAESQILATVSHQHIYGLLFKVLWPLASGRCFHSKNFLSPESLLKAAFKKPSVWIASPAQLKRLDQLSPWSEISQLKAIFSSGGTLDLEVAKQIQNHTGQQLIDIYGSSETGGIAWRKPLLDARWQPFCGISIEPIHQQQHLLTSSYLPANRPYFLNDKLKLDEDGRFILLGRNDRIVKIEEKRLSLNELENALQLSDKVNQAHCRLLSDRRERVASVIVLTTKGLGIIREHGKNILIKQLRSELLKTFEAVVLPKKWLFIKTLPLSTLGKIDHAWIDGLLSLDSKLFPQLQFFNQLNDGVELSLVIPEDSPYFVGHFPGLPILPGVTQLAWAEQYGKLFFPINLPFSGMEVVKFKKIIRPGDKMTLQLHWNPDNNKLYFDFSTIVESHSSGRLLYKAPV